MPVEASRHWGAKAPGGRLSGPLLGARGALSWGRPPSESRLAAPDSHGGVPTVGCRAAFARKGGAMTVGPVPFRRLPQPEPPPETGRTGSLRHHPLGVRRERETRKRPSQHRNYR